MPWVCNACQTEVAADDTACAACGAPKTSWTLRAEKTRAFVVSKRSFELLRGDADGPFGPEAALVPAGRHPARPLATVRALAADGAAPAAADVLVVRLVPHQARDLTVSVAVKYAGRPVRTAAIPVERPADLPRDGHVDVALLLALGDDDGEPARPGSRPSSACARTATRATPRRSRSRPSASARARSRSTRLAVGGAASTSRTPTSTTTAPSSCRTTRGARGTAARTSA